MNYPQIKPTLNLDFSNTKTLDPRINFRRGTPGAYYDGKTYAKAEENLLSYSEDFSDAENYWSEVRATLTGSQASPVDSTSAYKLSQTATGVAGVLVVNTGKIKLQIGKQYVSSVYVKAGDSNYFAIAEEVSIDSGLGGLFTYFNLSNSGEVMLSHENHIASIQNVGNQWYRCSIIFTAKKEEDYTMMFYLDSGSSQSTIDEPQNVTLGSSIYLWGAQLEQRDALTSYTKTNGTPVTKYQPQLMFASPDQPRFDHDALTGESKGLLIEESRTNLFEYSEDFNSTNWNKVDTNIFSNYVVAPDGTLTGDLIIPSTSAEEVFVGTQSSSNPNSLYLSTVYVKYAGIQWIRLMEAAGMGTVYFDILNGVVGNNNNDGIGTITSIGNGWFRCSIFRNIATTGNYFRIFLCDANGQSYCTASGTKGIYIWGAQLEEGSFPTSYIKTSGAPSGTERSADNVSITGENFSSWYRQDEGSLYSEINTFDATSGKSRISLGDASDRIFMANGAYSLYVQSGAGTQVDLSSTEKTHQYVKRAAALKKNDFAVCFDGASNLLTDSDGLMPFVDNLKFRDESGNDGYTNGHIKKLSYYPQRLTNEQLQQLTK